MELKDNLHDSPLNYLASQAYLSFIMEILTDL